MSTLLPALLAWRPFLDPIDIHTGWYVLLVPLALFIAIAYKAVRTKNMDRYYREVGVMTVQIIALMIGLAAASFLIVEVFARAAE